MPELTLANREARRTRIGASEVGALLDPHPYTSKARIYDRIVNDRGVDQTQVMRVGSILEGPVAKAWGLIEGRKVRANRRTFLSSVTTWLAATPDYFVIGERSLLEVKMTGDRWDDLPPYVAWQVRAQMHMTNRDLAYVCVVNGSQMRTFEVWRDMDAEAAMLEAVEGFGAQHLGPRIPPMFEQDKRDVMLRVWLPTDGTMVADAEMEQWGRAILEIQAINRQYKPLDEAARTGLVGRMVANDATAVVGNGWRGSLEGDPPSRLVIRG